MKFKSYNKKEGIKRIPQKVIDGLDAKEAERAKIEPRILLDTYIKKRWPKGIK